LIEKSLTYCWSWNYERIREEKDKGADIRFKYWEKGGLDVGLTYFGTYLGKMFTLDFEIVTTSNLLLRPEDWQDEINNEISFPIVNIEKIDFQEGYSSDKKQNNYLRDIMFEEVVEHLVDYERKKVVGVLQDVKTIPTHKKWKWPCRKQRANYQRRCRIPCFGLQGFYNSATTTFLKVVSE
jgi:hypothetical protein